MTPPPHSPSPDAVFPALRGRSSPLTARQISDYAYFCDALPDFPDPRRLAAHAEAFTEMSGEGAAFYMPWLVTLFEADPWGYDMVFHMTEAWIGRLADAGDPAMPALQARLARVASLRFGDDSGAPAER